MAANNLGCEELFGRLNGPLRVELLCKLFSQCSHQEQVTLMERLPVYLRRDFLSLLPPELVVKILYYLEPSDVFNCLLVSTQWNQIISDCDLYWKVVSKRAGITNRMLEEKRSIYGQMKGFAARILSFQKCIKKAEPKFLSFTEIPPGFDGVTLTVRPAEPTPPTGIFIGHEIHPDVSEFGRYRLSMRRVDSQGAMCEMAHVDVSHLFVIVWCTSSPNFVLVYGSSGEWLRCSFDRQPKRVVRWQDEIYSLAYYELGNCPECSLLGVLPKIPRENCLWDLEILQLRYIRVRPEKTKCTFSFLPDKKLKGNVFFQAHKIALLPSLQPHGHSRDGFCTEHQVLIQLGGGVVVFNLHLAETGFKLSEPLQVFCPENDPSYFATASVLGHRFCLSLDRKILACFVDGSYYKWQMDTGELYGSKFRDRDHRFSSNSDCLAVGHLFSVVYANGVIRVLSSVNGQLLLQYRVKSPNENPVFAPRHQEWLNSLEASVEQDFELAVMVTDWLNPGIIKFKGPTPLT